MMAVLNQLILSCVISNQLMHIFIKKNTLKSYKIPSTVSQTIQYRITQEIKFLHKKKQNLNSQLYRIHLKCADYCNGMWQHIRDSTETKIKGVKGFYMILMCYF